MSEPDTGWHYTVCKRCGDIVTKTTHYEGKQEINNCKYCENIEQVCFKCFCGEDDGE